MKYALELIGLLFALTALFIFAYYGNKNMLSCKINNKSVAIITQKRTTQKKNSKLNFLLIIIGILASNPTAGADFLAN